MGLLLDVASSWAFLVQHPLIGIAIFLASSAALIVVISGGRLTQTLGGMGRVVWTIFSTPFEYLRYAMTTVSNASEEERDYAHSRVFMLFRLSRIQYLGLLLVCLLGLSTGVASSIISLYPQSEIERERALATRVIELEGALETANQHVANVASPTFRETLQTQRTDARRAYQEQSQSNANFMNNTTNTGPLLNQLASAGSVDYLQRIQGGIENYMSSCPRGYNWRGMTVEMCNEYRAFAEELARRRISELQLMEAWQTAERAWRDGDSAAQSATEQAASLQAQLTDAQAALRGASLANLEWLGPRVMAALMGLLMTLLSTIFTVWFGATLISLFSWLVLAMRGIERYFSDYLERNRPPPPESDPS